VGCLDKVPDLEVKLGNYTMRDTFYIVDLVDTDVVLGVQWLITLGNISTNYQTLEMGFRDSEGKKIVLRGMSIGPLRTINLFLDRDFNKLEIPLVSGIFQQQVLL
jgi:hypothetical protein